jgi:hypothetical protein
MKWHQDVRSQSPFAPSHLGVIALINSSPLPDAMEPLRIGSGFHQKTLSRRGFVV